MPLPDLNDDLKLEQAASQLEKSSTANFFDEVRDTLNKKGNELFKQARDVADDLIGHLDLIDDTKSPESIDLKAAAKVDLEDKPSKSNEGFPAPGYKGEPGINRDLEPSVHDAVRGDTLDSIARKHLGKDASRAEVAAYAKEIAVINGYDKSHKIHPGEEIKLPGHTKDGGFVTVDGDGNTLTQWQDGKILASSPDGKRGFVRVDDGRGGSFEQGWGKEDEDYYFVHRKANGDLELLNPDGTPQNIHTDLAQKRLRNVWLKDRADEKAAEERVRNSQR